jgi:hypothetical protein
MTSQFRSVRYMHRAVCARSARLEPLARSDVMHGFVLPVIHIRAVTSVSHRTPGRDVTGTVPSIGVDIVKSLAAPGGPPGAELATWRRAGHEEQKKRDQMNLKPRTAY